jgi:hypothetical protein
MSHQAQLGRTDAPTGGLGFHSASGHSDLIALDLALARSNEAADGAAREGAVVVVDELTQTATVRDDQTKRRFLVSRRFVGAEAFDQLVVGTPVIFYSNGHNAVAAIIARTDS